MAWFDAFESINNKNKWRKLSIAADKRREAAKVLDEEKQRRDRIKKRYTDYSDSLDASGSILNRNKNRDRTSSYADARARIRKVEEEQPAKNKVFYPEGDSIAAQTQREFADIDATSEPHFKIAESEWPAQQDAKEQAERDKESQELRDELALRAIASQNQTSIKDLDLDNATDFAVRYALSPYNYIPLDSFADEDVRDFVTDVRSGNTDRLSELEGNNRMINSFLNETVRHFVSKFERPTALKTLAQDNELFSKESVGFEPTVVEYLNFSTEDLVNQFSPQWELEDGKLIPGGDRAVFPQDTQRIFEGSRLDREVSVMTLPPDRQADFIGAWFQTQLGLIEDGNFDQITAVPVFGNLLRNELETKLNVLIDKQRPPTDEEREELMFLALVTGYEEMPISDEQRTKILSHFGPLESKQLAALEAEYGEEYTLGDMLKTFIGRGDFLNDFVGRGPGAAPTIQDTDASKALADIMEFQIFARNLSKPENWEGLDIKYHPVSLLMESFDWGAKASRPLVRKYIVPILSPVVGEMIRQTGIPQLTQGIDTGLGALGVPDLTPDTEKVSRDVIESKIFETGLTEILNPTNVVFVFPFVGPGSRFVRAYQAGNKVLAAAILADEFALLGNTPAAIDSIIRGVAYTSRYGLRSTLTKFPALRSNDAFMRLVSGLDQKVVKREVEHEIGRVTGANADILQKNKALELLLSRGNATVEEATKGMDGNLIKSTVEAYNAGVVEYPLREDLAARLLDLDVLKTVDDGPAMVKSALEGKSTIGPGFPSGRRILGNVEDAIIPVTDDFIRLRKTRFETFGEMEDLIKEQGALRRELGEAVQNELPTEKIDELENKIKTLGDELDARGEVTEVADGKVYTLGDDSTDEWYLQKGIVAEEDLTVEDIRFADAVLEDPSRKPIGSGFIYDKYDGDYENRVAEVVRRADFVKEETGREFYFRESFDKETDGYTFSVFGVDDEAASFIRDNVDGLPTNVEDFVKFIDTNKNLSGDQKQFVDKLFDMGKSTDELDMDSVERVISSKIRGHVDDVNAIKTSDLSTKEGRQALADAQKDIIETIAYGVVRNDPQLGKRLTSKLSQLYDGYQTLPAESNGLMNAFGEFSALWDEVPATAIKGIWDDQVPNARRFVTQAKATESDSTLGAITRFMDETATIAITRQGDDKIVVEAVRFIDEPQATSLRTLIDNEGITDVSFSFDKVYGVRAGERQTLFKGKTGKAFDDVLRDSTGVCST